jgi:hypothetical protein
MAAALKAGVRCDSPKPRKGIANPAGIDAHMSFLELVRRSIGVIS